MHTISAEELLKAYNGKYKYVTMDKNGVVCLFSAKPIIWNSEWMYKNIDDKVAIIGKITITEFQDKDWTECIYEAKPSEEDMIGCIGWFWENDKEDKFLDVLVGIKDNSYRAEFVLDEFSNFRPATRDEIKFFNDDTSEE